MTEYKDILDCTHSVAGGYIKSAAHIWQVMGYIGDIIMQTGTLLGGEYVRPEEGVWVHRSAIISPTAMICPPCIIGADTQIRHCAFIRGRVIVGNGCVVGNSTELKNCILFDGVQAPHYNYVGDSILGYMAHMGAGSIISNVKADKSNVVIRGLKGADTGRKKFGAIVGDFTEIGCNSVINPGTVIGRNTVIYPLTSVRGVIGSDCIVKSSGNIVGRL